VLLGFFVIYSFLGVLVEMIFCLVQEGVLESRLGLLYPLAALARIRKRVAVLKARARGEAATISDTGWDRIDDLAPDSVMINSFPRTSLMMEFMELTGEPRAWIRVPGHPRSPSELHK
jgi:hypothetical protein